MEYLYAFTDLLNEMSPYLLLGFFVAGLLHVYVPQNVYANYFSGNDLRSVCYAALFGIPLPLCSCGVIPTAMSLRREGASRGAATSFLIATPQTGVDSIIATYSLMGLPFAVLRPIAALLTSVVGGCMVNYVCKEKDEPIGKVQNDVREKERKGGLKEVFRYGYVEMLQDIGKRLVLGLILAGLITIFVPESFFVQYADSSLKCMALVLLFSVPMYLCATGSIPIAVALMLKGLSPGAALVLLMAGPATNFAAILVVRKVLGVKALVVYLGTIIIGAIGFGLAIDYLLPQEWFLSDLKETSGHCGQTSWFKILSSVLFILLLLNAFFGKIGKAHHSCSCGCRRECVENDAKIYGVKGMNCNHCKANVERALLVLEGVRSAAAKIEACEVAIVGDVDEAVVKKTVEELGFKFEGRKL
jgi:uncharacterized membrane protein YraQ (UPF0718 family)/copper chaperone CopZ